MYRVWFLFGMPVGIVLGNTAFHWLSRTDKALLPEPFLSVFVIGGLACLILHIAIRATNRFLLAGRLGGDIYNAILKGSAFWGSAAASYLVFGFGALYFSAPN